MDAVTLELSTAREGMYAVTGKVAEIVARSGIEDGVVLVHCPHTTAGVTINENADPDVVHDLLLGLAKAFPDRPEFRHGEGNSSAHLKASCVGCGLTIIVEKGRMLLGTWQGIYFCEFDGPRRRKVIVKVRGA